MSSIKIRLLIITNHFWPEQFRINELALELKNRGYQVTVMTGIPNYPKGKYHEGYGITLRRKEQWNGISILRIPVVPRGNGSRFNLFLNYLSSLISFSIYSIYHGRQRFDSCLVFVTSPATIGVPAIIIRSLYHTPVVLWVLDLWPENIQAAGAVKNSIALSVVRHIMKWIYRRSDRILVASSSFTACVRNVSSYPFHIQYVPNWVESSLSHSQIENTIALPDLSDAFIVMYAGNIGAAQDWDKVIEAAVLLKNQPDVQWLIVGDGRDATRLKFRVLTEGLGQCVHFAGFHLPESMKAVYAVADVLLVTLKSDPVFSNTVPGKLQSYLSVGKPIVASLDGEGARIVKESGAGVVCPAGNSRALAKAILQMKNVNPEARAAMGHAGKHYAETYFSRTRIMDLFDQILRKIHKT